MVSWGSHWKGVKGLGTNTDAEQVTRYGEEEGCEAYDEERKRDGGERRVA